MRFLKFFQFLVAERATRKAISDAHALIAYYRYENLELRRSRLDILNAWRISIEVPESDIRDELDEQIRLQSDAISQLEEHVV